MYLLRKVVIISGLLLSLGCQSNTNADATRQGNKAHHTKDGFRNLHIVDPEKSFFDFLNMRFLGDEKWADHFSLAHEVPIQQVDVTKLLAPSEMPQVTWLGHASFLFQHKGMNILTDPIFSERASPLPFAGPKRYTQHPMDYALLPPIHAVLISHNHYDHLDNKTLAFLASHKQAIQTTHFYVPLGLKQHLLDLDIESEFITELDWYQSIEVEQNSVAMQIEALPSQHWSARGLSDRRETLWASWAVKISDFTLWFAGDTGYNTEDFSGIGRHLQHVDLALIPIGAYAPRWFMQTYHVNPAEALKIHQDINAQLSIGMHWGTFPLTAEAPMEPVIVLDAEKRENNLDMASFITLPIGATYLINNTDN